MYRGGLPRGWSTGYCNHMADSYGTMGFQLVVSRETDPVWNLAMEEIMFSELAAGSCRLFVYRNSDSVICGRFQNPWLEADTNWLAEQDVPLVRRASGGGTVWHDTGNWNFSFMMDRDGFDQQANLGFLGRCLEKLGFPVSITGRGDLFLDGRKVSGNAMVKKSDRVLHHASLLVDSDLARLRRSLRLEIPQEMLVRSRGVASVRSPVTRLADHCSSERLAGLWDEILQILTMSLNTDCRFSGGTDLNGIDQLVGRNTSWDWNFGQTPEFTLTPATRPELALTIRDGRVLDSFGAQALGLSGQIFPGVAGLVRMGFVGLNGQ